MGIYDGTYYTTTSTATWPTSSDNYIVYDPGEARIRIMSDMKYTPKEMKFKSPIATAIVNMGVPLDCIIILGGRNDINEHFSDTAYSIRIAAHYDPLQDSYIPQRGKFSLAIMLYCIDKVKEPMEKANMIREALITLVKESENRLLPQVLIFSKDMNADELLDLSMYAGAKSSWPIELKGIGEVCIAASMKEKE